MRKSFAHFKSILKQRTGIKFLLLGVVLLLAFQNCAQSHPDSDETNPAPVPDPKVFNYEKVSHVHVDQVGKVTRVSLSLISKGIVELVIAQDPEPLSCSFKVKMKVLDETQFEVLFSAINEVRSADCDGLLDKQFQFEYDDNKIIIKDQQNPILELFKFQLGSE